MISYFDNKDYNDIYDRYKDESFISEDKHEYRYEKHLPNQHKFSALPPEKLKKFREAIQEYNLFDDIFFRAVFKDNIEATQYMINTILGRDDLVVISVETQFDITNLKGRSIILDIYAVDANGKVYNIEIQNSNDGAGKKRVRYHTGMIDSNANIDKSEDVEKLPDIHIIFITKNDILKGNKALYHVDKVIRETGEPYDDGSYIIYVNGSYNNTNTEIGRLIHDMHCKKVNEMYVPELAKSVNAIKNTEGGYEEMKDLRDEWYYELYGEQIKKDREQMRKELEKELKKEFEDKEERLSKQFAEQVEKQVAQQVAEQKSDISRFITKMLKDGSSIDEISSMFQSVSREEIEEMAKNLK